MTGSVHDIVVRPGRPTARLAAVGDLSLNPRVLHGARVGSANDSEVDRILDTADLAFANLECAFSDDRAGIFVAPSRACSLFKSRGFTHVHLANNHIYDAGPAGLLQTLQELRQCGTEPLGAGDDLEQASALKVDHCNGLTIGWLAAGRTGVDQDPGGPRFFELERSDLLRRVANSKAQTNVLIVSLHLGFMYVDYPDPDHRAYAHRLAEAGADLVLMHHPHVLQGIEVTDGGAVICYSLGNFLVDWTAGLLQHDIRTQEQTEGGIFLFDLDEHGVQRVQVVPTRITANCTVELATGEHAAAIVSRLERISADLSGDYVPEYLRQRAAFNTQLGLRSLLSLARGGQFRELFRMLRRARPAHLGMLWRWLRGAEPA